MKSTPIELGAVFQTEWSENPIRVIAFDNSVVMYDAWWPHSSTWGMGKLSGNFCYYRLPLTLLMQEAKYLRTEKYTDQEARVHRPDLPFAFAQYNVLDWYAQCPESMSQLEQFLESRSAFGTELLLKVPAIYLSPFGPKGSSKSEVLVHAKNGESFTEAEILWHAWQLQIPHLRAHQLTSGVGVYRSGIKKRIPTYYIWGCKSRLDEVILSEA